MRLPMLLAAAALLAGGCSSSDGTVLNPDVKPDTTVVMDFNPPMK